MYNNVMNRLNVQDGWIHHIEMQTICSLSSKASKNYGTSPDQARLRDLGDEIINSNMLSIFAGAVFKF